MDRKVKSKKNKKLLLALLFIALVFFLFFVRLIITTITSNKKIQNTKLLYDHIENMDFINYNTINEFIDNSNSASFVGYYDITKNKIKSVSSLSSNQECLEKPCLVENNSIKLLTNDSAIIQAYKEYPSSYSQNTDILSNPTLVINTTSKQYFSYKLNKNNLDWKIPLGKYQSSPHKLIDKNIAIDKNNETYLIGKYFSKTDFDPTNKEDIHSSCNSESTYLTKYNSNGDYSHTRVFSDDASQRTLPKSLLTASDQLFLILSFSGGKASNKKFDDRCFNNTDFDLNSEVFSDPINTTLSFLNVTADKTEIIETWEGESYVDSVTNNDEIFILTQIKSDKLNKDYRLRKFDAKNNTLNLIELENKNILEVYDDDGRYTLTFPHVSFKNMRINKNNQVEFSGVYNIRFESGHDKSNIKHLLDNPATKIQSLESEKPLHLNFDMTKTHDYFNFGYNPMYQSEKTKGDFVSKYTLEGKYIDTILIEDDDDQFDTAIITNGLTELIPENIQIIDYKEDPNHESAYFIGKIK